MTWKKHLNVNTKPHKFKATPIPSGFVLVRDTREQQPLFTRTKDLMVLVKTLHDGDYSIRGFEDQFAIELKRESDFYGYIGAERDKTIKKLKRLAGFDFAALVVEGLSWDDLAVQNSRSALTPSHVRGFVASLNTIHGIHFFCHRDRKIVERWILDRAVKFYRQQRVI